MKKNIISIVLTFVLLFQVKSFAGIKNSAHDFSTAGIRDSHGIGEICKICHTPHNSGSKEVPLWRGHLSSSVTFTLYKSDTLDASVNQPMAPTKACLTCHDGSVAKQKVTSCGSCHFASTKHPDYPVRDTNLGNDHPVSFKYDSDLLKKDTALVDPGTPVPSLGGKPIKTGMLYQERLECSSCHDVHATKGDSKYPTTKHLLLVDNKNDGLCFTCHIK